MVAVCMNMYIQYICQAESSEPQIQLRLSSAAKEIHLQIIVSLTLLLSEMQWLLLISTNSVHLEFVATEARQFHP